MAKGGRGFLVVWIKRTESTCPGIFVPFPFAGVNKDCHEELPHHPHVIGRYKGGRASRMQQTAQGNSKDMQANLLATLLHRHVAKAAVPIRNLEGAQQATIDAPVQESIPVWRLSHLA
jgi:hypothetical protein